MTKEQIMSHLNGVYDEISDALGFEPFCYFAGGAIASLVLDEEPKDYDIWFELPEFFKEVEDCEFVKTKMREKSKYAISIDLPSGKKLQFVESRMGHPDRVIKTFDFKHTQSYYTPYKDLVYDEKFIKLKRLEFEGRFDHPVNTMERIIKFSKRGYFVPPETLEKILLLSKTTSETTIKNSTNTRGSL